MNLLKQHGFSVIEMIVAMAALLIVVGAVLQLVSQSQQRYVSASTVEDTTAMLREGVDQVVREIRLAGYPAANSYPCPPPAGATYSNCLTYQTSGYIAGGVLVANPYSIHFEADTDGDNRAEVFNYELQVPTGGAAGGCAGLTENSNLTTPTLMRSAVAKNVDGSVPAAELYPLLENVRNCELNSTPIFTYCPAPPAGAPAECPTMTNYVPSSLPAPRNTRIVLIRLQAEVAVRDPQTGQFQNIEQFGLAERVNPDQ